ncbi:hypothetical protein Lser_V15G33203 [Lactuca serriola]
MASSSSSSIMASPSANTCSFDVFLSFRGEDVRHSFADHLYEALKRAGFLTFRDEEEIKKGEPLKPEIVSAIKGSKASIVVLSKNYATSTWCLDELLLILEERRHSSHFVLPIFYHVDPSDVRKQNKTFDIKVITSSQWTDKNVKLWKAALTEVASLSGEVSEAHETEFLKKIVDIIYNKLDHRKLHLPDNLTGMAPRYEDISSFINEPNVNILAICGMGGSGKTTLAKYIYNSNWNSFENMSYLEEIGSRCKVYDELLQQQERLLHDILGGKNRQIPSVSEATSNIKEALNTKRAFIVLDDIANRDQLVALLGNGKINAKSKIIITTTVLNIEEWFNSGSRCRKYEMRLLNYDESLELFCRHAFRSKFPIEGFKELTLKAVRYCEGNPLALEVLGSSLSVDNNIQVWGSTLSSFENNLHDKIQCVLIDSYNSLPHDCNRKLFLHIACFFVGKDKDYVENILEGDFSATSGIKILCDRCLLSVSLKNELMMHRLLQEVGKDIVVKESEVLTERSRVWRSRDSYKILRRGKGSERVEGLALDMERLKEEEFAVRPSKLKTDALNNMDNLKLLQLNSVQLTGSYENFSEDLRWLCWFGFHLENIPCELFMGNLVAIDMSSSKLKVFEPPTELTSLKILNLKDSDNLIRIHNMFKIPHLEILILWNCHSLVRVCETIKNLNTLALLNMTGCEKLFKDETKLLAGKKGSTSDGGVAKQPTFSFLPQSLHRLFLKGCNLEQTDSFPLSFSAQPSLQYLNLGHGLFEFLPDYNHLENLRVLDLSFCSRLKSIKCLPSTLAELYVYYCRSLEIINFVSHQFTLQEFGYKGCISLSEVEGLFKLVPVSKLEENDLGHMKWIKEYQNQEVCLVGDDELTKDRSACVQMLYEFNIMSTSLLDIKDPNMKPNYVSELSSLNFYVPSSPKNRTLKGLDVMFKYTITGDDWAWFCKISTTNGVDLMYNPKVFGKPDSGKVGIWLSYWPIGSTLHIGDVVNISIIVMSGMEVQGCGVSLVYAEENVAKETFENNMDWEEILQGDLSGFQLSTGAYYLCRNDFFGLMEVGRLTDDWFRILVGDTIDHAEVRGWRKTGRRKQLNPSFTELKTVRCIIHGPQSEEVYKIANMSKSMFVDKNLGFSSTMFGEMKSATSSKSSDTTAKELNKIQNVESMDMSKASVLNEIQQSTSSSYGEEPDSWFTHHAGDKGKRSLKVVLKVDFSNDKEKRKVLKKVIGSSGVESVSADMEDKKLTVTGEIDPVEIVTILRKSWRTELVAVGPAKEEKRDGKKEEKRDGKKEDKDDDQKKKEEALLEAYKSYNPYMPQVAMVADGRKMQR